MVSPSLRCIATTFCAALISAGCIPSAPAQGTAPYMFCYTTGSSAAPQGASIAFYFSNIFSYNPASLTLIPVAFAQAMRQRGITISTGPICPETGTLQAVTQAKQVMEIQTLPVVQQQYAAAGKTLSVVETGWTYQAATPSVAGASYLTPTSAAAANPALAAGANINPSQSLDATGKALQQGAQQTVNSTVYGAETSTVGAIDGTMNKAATSVQNNISDGINKMFRKKKGPSAPEAVAAPVAPASTLAAPTQLPAVQPAALTPQPSAFGAAGVPPPSAFGPPITRPAIQDEGDGKHWILTTPGQSDARELVRVPGSKNAYLEESTGDKYIVMPNGDITHIPHKPAAK